MYQFRETIWGIHPKDRRWFQFLTLLGGTAGSVVLTLLELEALSGSMAAMPSAAARNIVLGMGGSFAASGFIAWGVIQVKEMPMAIADWIREATERRRERWRREAMQIGYQMGYADSQAGKPPTPPGDSESKAEGPRDDESGKRS